MTTIRKLSVVAVATGVLIGAPVATSKPTTGKFKTTSGPHLSFSIKRMVCAGAPKNLKHPKARAGKRRLGLCFQSVSQPPVDPVCPPPGTISGETALVDAFSGLLLSSSGTLHIKAYSYESGSAPIGYTELSLKVIGGNATGFIRLVTTIYPNEVATTCDTGKLKFSARRV